MKRVSLQAEAKVEVAHLAMEKKEQLTHFKAGIRKGKKPKVPSAFRQFMMQRALVKKKKAKFVVEEIARAEKDTKMRWLALKKERAASSGLQYFLDGVIDEMMEEVVVDSLRTSEREKDPPRDL